MYTATLYRQEGNKPYMRRNNAFSMDFWKPALGLAIPVALQNLLMNSAGLINTLMIGRLGDIPVAAVGMGTQWSWIMSVLFFGVSSGAAVFLSQFWGAKDETGIRCAYGLLAASILCVALLMFLVALLWPSFVIGLFTGDGAVIELGVEYLRYARYSYIALALSQTFSTVLRSMERVRLPLAGSAVSVLLNIVLNYGLIFGNLGLPAMGVAGAALSTTISTWAGAVMVFVASLFQRNALICAPRKLFSFDGAFVRQFFRVVSPALLNEALWAVGTTGYNMIFGHMGTVQFAAVAIFRTIEGVFFSFYVGICHACGVLVGREIGASRIKEAISYADRFTAAMPIYSLLIGGAMLAAKGPLLSLMGVSEETMRLVSLVMLLYAVEIPIRNIPYLTICGVFRPGGDTNAGLRYDTMTVWLLALPATAVAGLLLKLDFVAVYAIMFVMEDWPKAFLCVRRLKSREWIRPVVRQRLEP